MQANPQTVHAGLQQVFAKSTVASLSCMRKSKASAHQNSCATTDDTPTLQDVQNCSFKKHLSQHTHYQGRGGRVSTDDNTASDSDASAKGEREEGAIPLEAGACSSSLESLGQEVEDAIQYSAKSCVGVQVSDR